jgi:hypothetical protein
MSEQCTSVIRWTNADDNSAGWIVAQSGTPIKFEGPPGVAKSSTIHQLAQQLGRELLMLIGSTHAPEDFSGIPFVSDKRDFFEMTPPKFAERLTRPGCVLFIDEINTSPPSILAAELSMLTEKRLGDMKIHPDTMFVAACNPPAMAPNASPLPKSMNNRFYHAKWKHDFESWAQGMESEANDWGKPEFPAIDPDWRRFRPQFGSLIVSFLRANPSMRIAVPDNDEQMAFPTPRSWTYLRDALAAAESINAPVNIQNQICKGLLGDTAAGQFMRHIKIADLINAEAILDGSEEFKYDKKRPDLAVCLLPALVTAVKKQYTPERLDRAVKTFIVAVGSHQKDLVFSQLKHLVKCKPSNETFSQGSMDLIGQFAKTIPTAVRGRSGPNKPGSTFGL